MSLAVAQALASSSFGLTRCPHCGQRGAPGETFCMDCGRSMSLDAASNAKDASALVLESSASSTTGAAAQPPSLDEKTSNLAVTVAAQESDPNAAQNEEEQSSQSPHSSDATRATEAAGKGAAGKSAKNEADTQQEQADLRELQQRDREVRAHEQAHIASGGGVVSGGASFSYQTGPDGKQYATGGEVAVDASAVPGNPEATEQKAEAVRRAALAPATPSAQDQKVAAQASTMAAKARQEKIEKRQEENGENAPTQGEPNASERLAPEKDESEPSPTDLAAAALTPSSGAASGSPLIQQALSAYAQAAAETDPGAQAQELARESERAAPFSSTPRFSRYA